MALGSLHVLEGYFVRRRIDPWAFWPRLAFWFPAAAVVAIAWYADGRWYQDLGLSMPSWNDIPYILFALITIYLVVGTYEALKENIRKQRRKNRKSGKLQNALYRSEVQRFGSV